MHYLQTIAGGNAPFEAFFRSYVQTFALKTVSSDDFKALYLKTFPVSEHPRVAEIDWDAWLYAPGMPPVTNVYDETLAHAASALAVSWHVADPLGLGTPPGPPEASPKDIEGWSSAQVVAFLDRLAELRGMQPLSKAAAQRLGKVYGLEATQNSEIRASLLRIQIAAGDEDCLERALAFVTSQGRMKFVRPIYKALARSSFGAEAAKTTFAEHKAFYHPIAAKMLEVDLGLKRADE